MHNFRLWIDAVGGYLVCPSRQVRLGQWTPTPAAQVAADAIDIALLADVASHHATFYRHEEGYLIEAIHSATVDDRPITGKVLLRNGHRLQLGRNVLLLFRQPTALSGSAVLELISRHHAQPAVTAIILMAETCLLGPTAACHVVCPSWRRQVVLQQNSDELCAVTSGEFEVGGVNYRGRASLPWGQLVDGGDFSFSTELA